MKAIVLAAGKGTRLADPKNPCPKVLRKVSDKPILDYVLNTINFIDKSDIIIVTGYLAEMVEERYNDFQCVRQGKDAYGTGYAVKSVIEQINLNNIDDDILILNGDSPLFRKETVKGLCEHHKQNNFDCTILSCDTKIKLPYGRVIKDKDNNLIGIVEEAECNDTQLAITELNVGMYVFKCKELINSINKINNNNNKGEYYITDCIPVLANERKKLGSYVFNREDEIIGVNTPDDLETATKIINCRK